jgi:hypothetical protein
VGFVWRTQETLLVQQVKRLLVTSIYKSVVSRLRQTIRRLLQAVECL